MKDILKSIANVIVSVPNEPVPPIDPLTILQTVKNPGLSPRKIASEIIARQNEAGAPFGPLPSGADNVAEKMELIRVQEIVKALQQDARITVSIPPGIQILGATTTGPPISVVGSTTSPAHIGYAVIQ